MNLKVLAVLTMVCWFVLFTMAFMYELPLAYVPEGASLIEQDMYNILFITIEAVIFTYLFAHMMMKSKLKLYGSIWNIFK